MRRLAFALVLLALTAACTSDEPDEPKRTLAPVRLSPEEVRAAVEGFDPGTDGSIHALNRAAIHGEDQGVVLEALLASDDSSERWAATYVLAIAIQSLDEAEALVALMRDPSPSVRLTAAGALCGLGHPASIPVLIEGLGRTAPMPFSDPPRPASAFARETLEAYTGQTFATRAEWQDWFDGVGDDLRWNGETYGTP